MSINVLVLARTTESDIESIKAVAPERLNVFDGWRAFQDEIFEDWPASLRKRSGLPGGATTHAEQRERILASADAVLLGYPYPKHIVARMPRLRWAHLAGAGVSSLRNSDWWASPVATTSSRGHTNAELIAETVMAAVLMLAKGLDTAAINSKARDFSIASYRQPLQVAGKTMGILGTGGIGRCAARLAKACGMRVVGLRRNVNGQPCSDADFEAVWGPDGLTSLLQQSDFLVVAAMLTDETQGLLGEEQFAALKPGAYVINVARGEIVQEQALASALASGRVAGAYLDVWTDDMASPPIPELLDAPNVIFTPHISGRSENPARSSIQFFCENLRRLVNGRPLENLVDWRRGY